MTIIVFDQDKKIAYSDGRASTSIGRGDRYVVSDRYNKLFRHKDKVFGFSGDCKSFKIFLEKYKKGVVKKTSNYHFSGCFYDAIKNKVTLIVVRPNNRIYFYVMAFLIISTASFYLEQKTIGLISFALSCLCLKIPDYIVEIKREREGRGTLSFGSGSNIFQKRFEIHKDSFKAISSVHIEDPCCNSFINSMPIDGRYFAEDTH